MNRSTRQRMLPSALVLSALAFAMLAMATLAGSASATPKHTPERLVVRGEATVKDSPCRGGLCLELTDATFRGTPVGTGAYTGSMHLKLAEAFPNGEGGLCAPIRGDIVLGAGSPDRLLLAIAGNSCQDGAGNPATSSFTGLARFVVQQGTGAFAKARGAGVAVFAEDAADRDHMTLLGRLQR